MPETTPPPSPTERTLVVMRHAKAEQAAPTDAERPLAERGHVDAEAAGRWLAEQGVHPDAALVSAARRTEETYAAVARGAGWDLAPTLEPGLYAAGPEAAVDLVRLVDDEVRTLVVIGHNPTMGSLALLLDDGTGDADASAVAAQGFPTSALVVFAYDGSWADLAPGTASLTASHVGRG
ncbi:histidine phosphatase family protein [Nocardioides nanhaiensis]|uniref:Histidine phosphatase family protein n=1 Tax=Nocardioides nanhaiensis TaxID=1476871 RepID=A0ABP8WNU7_9ACTN